MFVYSTTYCLPCYGQILVDNGHQSLNILQTKEVGTFGNSYLNKACEFKHRGKMNDI